MYDKIDKSISDIITSIYFYCGYLKNAQDSRIWGYDLWHERISAGRESNACYDPLWILSTVVWNRSCNLTDDEFDSALFIKSIPI